MSGPFHKGEVQVQELAGESQMADSNGAMIASRVMGGARAFLGQQAMVVLASQDRQGELWCSIVFGKPGFLHSDDGYAVDIDLASVSRNAGDPLWANLREGVAVGILVIELATRRRLRINGVITWLSEEVVRLNVVESYPNCPKYITRRAVKTLAVDVGEISEARDGTVLGVDEIALLEQADVFFLGTSHAERGMDASHRGGSPGFVKVVDAQTLLIPDFPGNSMFNTLGNLAVNAKAGMVVPDFGRRLTLQLTGEGETLWNVEDPGEASGGTHRFLKFHVRSWIQLPMPREVHAVFLEYSPFNPVAGG